MKRAEFLLCVRKPEELPAGAAQGLEDIVGMYPYFQGGHVLLALAFNRSEEIRFPEALKNAAIYSGDRRHLHHLLYGYPKKIREIVKEPAVEVESVTEALQPALPGIEPELELHPQVAVDILSQILSYPEIERNTVTIAVAEDAVQESPVEKEVVREAEELKGPETLAADGKHSFSDWLRQVGTTRSDDHQEVEARVSVDEGAVEPAGNLIERFIQTEPRISKPVKTEFFSPVSMARKSVEDNDDIVSETLAKIYADQGSTDRAIRIYQKLSLLYPEKSGYFAALIQNLENPELL